MFQDDVQIGDKGKKGKGTSALDFLLAPIDGNASGDGDGKNSKDKSQDKSKGKGGSLFGDDDSDTGGRSKPSSRLGPAPKPAPQSTTTNTTTTTTTTTSGSGSGSGNGSGNGSGSGSGSGGKNGGSGVRSQGPTGDAPANPVIDPLSLLGAGDDKEEKTVVIDSDSDSDDDPLVPRAGSADNPLQESSGAGSGSGSGSKGVEGKVSKAEGKGEKKNASKPKKSSFVPFSMGPLPSEKKQQEQQAEPAYVTDKDFRHEHKNTYGTEFKVYMHDNISRVPDHESNPLYYTMRIHYSADAILIYKKEPDIPRVRLSIFDITSADPVMDDDTLIKLVCYRPVRGEQFPPLTPETKIDTLRGRRDSTEELDEVKFLVYLRFENGPSRFACWKELCYYINRMNHKKHPRWY